VLGENLKKKEKEKEKEFELSGFERKISPTILWVNNESAISL
jgi:hypothetical protein